MDKYENDELMARVFQDDEIEGNGFSDFSDEDDFLGSKEPAEVSVKLVRDDNNYNPLPFIDLPVGIQEAIASGVSKLVYPTQRKLLVVGDAGMGKTFYVHHLARYASRFTADLGMNAYHFVRLDYEDAMRYVVNGSINSLVEKMCSALNCYENDLCFVVDSPSFGVMVNDATRSARVIVEFDSAQEVDEPLSNKLESWDVVNVNKDFKITKKEMLEFVPAVCGNMIVSTFKVDDTIVRNATRLVMDEIRLSQKISLRAHDVFPVPFGLVISLVRSSVGAFVFQVGDPKNLRSMVKKTISENNEMISDFVQDSKEPSGVGVFLTHPVLGSLPIPEEFIMSAHKSLMEHREKKDNNKRAATDDQNAGLAFNDLKDLRSVLDEKIFGQDNAVDEIVESFILPASGIRLDKHKPVQSFLFLGPTGTGKTEVSKLLSENLYTEKAPFIRVDMSEFGKEHEVSKLFGAPPGYVGYEDNNTLLDKVKATPQCIILLDEVEKAHPSVWDAFLQVFDDGRMTSGQGETVDFSQAVIIMTSNLGAKEMQSHTLGFSSGIGSEIEADKHAKNKSAAHRALKEVFRPEMINRIDNIVVFQALSKESARQVVRKEINNFNEVLKSTEFVLDEVGDDIVDKILSLSDVDMYGAREVQRTLRKHMYNPVGKAIVGQEKAKNRTLRLALDESGQISVERKK